MACILGTGAQGIVSVYELDPHFILKGHEVWHDGRRKWAFVPATRSKAALAVEDIIYKRLGFHPHILKYAGRVLAAEDSFSLKIERAMGDLRSLMLKCAAPAEQIRLQMVVQISSGMAHIHSQNVFHCDFSCRNIFVFEDWLVKIGDFGGSKIDDKEPLSAEEVRYELPLRGREWEARDYTKREIFALGCAIYEIMMWKKPFAEITNNEVDENYANEVFPDTNGLQVGDIVRACWKEEYATAKDVEGALKKQLLDTQDIASLSLRR